MINILPKQNTKTEFEFEYAFKLTTFMYHLLVLF